MVVSTWPLFLNKLQELRFKTFFAAYQVIDHHIMLKSKPVQIADLHAWLQHGYQYAVLGTGFGNDIVLFQQLYQFFIVCALEFHHLILGEDLFYRSGCQQVTIFQYGDMGAYFFNF